MAYYKEPKYEEKEDDYFPFSSASIVAYEYKLLYHEKFFEHLHMKRLVIDENIPFPVSTWERSYRYKGYGYNMCRETKKKLLQAIKGVNVEEEPYNMIKDFGMEPNEEYNNEERWNSTVVEFTRENVLKQLEEDVRFGFEKALNQRGISASLMFECVMMWNYILEEGLEDRDEDDYGFYGLPLFKATAVKYGWDNPIGEDSGRERKYDSQY